MPVRIPTNDYADNVTERDATLAILEELRAIKWSVLVFTFFAVPLMIVAIFRMTVGSPHLSTPVDRFAKAINPAPRPSRYPRTPWSSSRVGGSV